MEKAGAERVASTLLTKAGRNGKSRRRTEGAVVPRNRSAEVRAGLGQKKMAHDEELWVTVHGLN